MAMAATVAAADAVVFRCNVQILAYLVIIPTRTSENFSGCVEVDRQEHQLPLAEVTVS